MQTPVDLALYADRNVRFSTTIGFFGDDLTGSSFRMQIRLNPDTGGSPIVSLTSSSGISLIYAGTDTVANHVTAGRMTEKQIPTGFGDTDNLTLSLVNIQIAKATMAFSSYPADENGDDTLLAYDLLVTPAAGSEDKYLYGPFVLRGTVTQ